LSSKLASAQSVKVVGVIRPQEDATISTTGSIAYLPALMQDMVLQVAQSDVVKAQLLTPTIDIFTGEPFQTATYPGETVTTYEDNMTRIGYSQLEKPKQINIYPKDFEAKEVLTTMISNYNNEVEEGKKITYVDMIGLMLSSVSAIVTGVSTVLICFVGISLVVSSIMIGIITYISVLERTKEIGILRAIGASKRDISRVFNAETTIIGLAAGVFGILATLLLTIPINAIIRSFTDIAATAMISIWNVLILVAISVILTLIAGLIPARMAAKKDPVIALRSE
jgi:putative ABC transport system permease protein